MMNNYIEGYKKYLNLKNLSKNTINSYIYDIKNYEEYLQENYNTDIIKTKKANILTYLVNIQKQGKSSSTISRTISSLKNFFEYLKKEKIVADNPALSIHSPKQVKKIPLILKEEVVKKLMNLPDVCTFKGSRDRAILELMYSSGIKVSELINIKINDINFKLDLIKIEGSRERIVPLNNFSKKAIIRYVEKFRNKKVKNNNDYLFVNITGKPISRQGIWKILKFYEKKLENLELSPQILRNSFAVHLLSHGADIGTLQELMGLSSITAAQSYLQGLEFKSLEVFKKTFPRI